MTDERSSPATPRDRLTAFHEAGHAVVAHLLGLTVSQVEVIGNGEDFGSCHTLRLPSGEAIAREHALEDALLVACAGAVAECIASGAKEWDEDSHDLERAVHLALQLTGDCEKAHALILRTRRRVRRALMRHWNAVETLAEVLLRNGRADSAEVSRIVQECPPKRRGRRRTGSTAANRLAVGLDPGTPHGETTGSTRAGGCNAAPFRGK